MDTIEFFFDYSCPFAYLASTEIRALAARTGAQVEYRPMLLGGLFRDIGQPTNLAASLHPLKARHNSQDMARWADLRGVPLRMPAGHPLRTVEALRATLAAPAAARADVVHALFRAYWADSVDISNTAALAQTLNELGLEGNTLAGPHSDAIKAELRANTDEAVARGVFGAPTFFARGAMFYGQDRMFLLERALGGAGERTTHLPGWQGEASAQRPRTMDFWYDFSSPFTYLASTQIPALAERLGVAVRWRPVLLGGLFKTLGGPIVPMAVLPAPKQRWVARDMQAWAEYWAVDYKWPSRFPMRTVLPLRVACALGASAEPFIHRCFRAYWAENQDISDPGVVAALLEEVGASPLLIEASEDAAVKAALIDSTQAAADAGVFGAPSVVIQGKVFWGQDRLGMVERVLEGWVPPV
jgi:2-hydroxychromene-2-carboxylate isomerase